MSRRRLGSAGSARSTVIGHGHQLRGSVLGGAQRPLLMLGFAALGARIPVIVAVAQHGVDELGRLVGRGGDGLGGPSWVVLRRRRVPKVLSAQRYPWTAKFNADAAGLGRSGQESGSERHPMVTTAAVSR